MDDPQVSDLRKSRIIDEDELNRRLIKIIEVNYTLEQSKQILLHGKVKTDPDPWEELVHELSDALGFLPGQQSTVRLEAALLKLRVLVERKED
jgi:hypothetical protein